MELRTVVQIAKNYESLTDARRLTRQVRGDQEQVSWTRKAPHVNPKKSQLPSRSKSKCTSPKQSECCYCGAIPGHPKEKCRAVILKYVCGRCGKEGHIARKCLSKPQNVNALDESLSGNGQETYHLFTPNFSEIVKPLTELTHVDAVWSWSSQHDKAFSSAKRAITNATTLKFFDVDKWMPVTPASGDPYYKMANQ